MSYPIDVFIGNKLCNARIEANMSQGELAKEMKITRQMLSKYEIGKSSLTMQRLNEVTKILNKDFNYFHEGYSAGEKLIKKRDRLAKIDRDPKLLEILDLYSKLSPDLRKIITRLLRSIKSSKINTSKNEEQISDIQALAYIRSFRNLPAKRRSIIVSLVKKLESIKC
ncbi:MAG: helix-turn-helix transcriptional regulator [Proteobacteria bacterium]|nr:helix-turn-helix transcriptional regulator [Pseudomonadota bacterium]